MGFKLRLTELEKGAVNVVVQPGQWPTPRVDHLGFVLDEDEFDTAIERAERNDLRVQEHGGRRTFVSTNAGYRLELHPPREWIHELLAQGDELQLSELHLKADDPSGKAKALAEILDADRDGTDVEVGETVVRFVRGGPQGSPSSSANCSLGHVRNQVPDMYGSDSPPSAVGHAPGHRGHVRNRFRTCRNGHAGASATS